MELHFRALGHGQPLIILHGLLGSLDNWFTHAKRFAETFQVFLLDLRNHGSSPHSEEFSYELMTDDLAEFFVRHQLQHTRVIGHSMGGKTAMHFALRHPRLVAKLVIVDIAPRAYAPVHKEILDALLALNLQNFQRRDEMDSALQAAIPEPAMRQFLLKNVGRSTNGGFFWKPNLAAIRKNYAGLNPALDSEQIFSGPTLFLRGDKSDYVSDDDFKSAQRFFPNSKLRTIADAGHWVHAEKPEEFFQVVLQFLTEA